MESIVTYKVEICETTGQIRKQLKAMEVVYWRHHSRLTLHDGVRNEDICGRLNIETTVMDTVDVKKVRWYGHKLPLITNK